MRNMKRVIVAGFLGLAFVGCAQTKTNVAKDGSAPVPVALTPVPSIYESINRGVGAKKVQEKTLKETAAPHWAGRVREPGKRDGLTIPAMAMASRPKGDTAPRVLATPGGGEPAASAAEPKAAAYPAVPVALGGTQSASGEPKGEVSPPTAPEPLEASGPGNTSNPVISANGLLPVTEPTPDASKATASAEPATDNATLAAPAQASADDAPKADPIAAKGDTPTTDPLLGPNPPLMPIPTDPAKVTTQTAENLGEKAPNAAAVETQVEPKSAESALVTSAGPEAPPAPSSGGGDPLLGPNPVLMPLPGLQESKNAPVPEAAKLPAGTPAIEQPKSAEAELPSLAAPDASPEALATSPVSTELPPQNEGEAAPKAAEALPTLSEAAPVAPLAETSPDREPNASTAPAVESQKLPAQPDPKKSPATDEAADDDSLPENIPIVGTAKDENGEEFGLPALPEEASPSAAPSDSPVKKPETSPATSPSTPKQTPADSLPPLGELPASTPAAAAPTGPQASAPSTPGSPQDPGVRKVAASPTDLQTPPMSRNVKEAGRAAAGVGEEIITLNDLVLAVREFRKKHPSQQPPSKDEMNMMGKGILLMLIERSLLTQEAKRVLKNPKMLDQLMSFAEKAWAEEELPPMLRKYLAANVYELKDKMAADNRNLDAIHDSFRKDFLAQAFLQQKIGGKLKVDLPEMLRYYEDHKSDREYHRPASIRWREILVETKKYPDPKQAREKAKALVERLRKGEDFAKLARAESDGPDLAKSAGGLMETSPGSYNVAEVNRAIETLPIGKVSDILEGSNSLHIVIVENRRPAGPLSFAEMQDQIRKALHEEKIQKERIALITKLRQNTVVWTIFDNTESDPYR